MNWFSAREKRCQNKNSMVLLETVKKELKIAKDGLSADKKVHLTTQNCMKQCRTSPNMKIDGKLYTGLTEEKVLGLIRTFKIGKGKHDEIQGVII